MKTVEINRRLLTEALTHLKLAQEDSYVEETQDVINELQKVLQQPVSRNISLWMEGFAATGESGTAQYIGTYNAKDLDDAVKQYMEVRPNSVHWDRFGRGRHAIWACEIFDNEADARKSFG